jgi:predicted DNA-binding protein (MmcQ/YjbR family)
MATPTTPKQAAAALRKFALSFPETHEDHPWGECAVKVGKKAFLFMRSDKTGLSLSTKLVESNEEALEHDFAKPTAYGLGKSGWITASFGPKDKVPVALLERWIDESYRAIAPKKFVAQLADPSTPRLKPSQQG